MAETEQESSAPRLSKRIETYRQEIQNLVRQGGEQPQYEFKRTVTLGREDLDERLDFIKLVQALANADIASERCVVIGADPRDKKFYPVLNAPDFDPANLSKIFSKYLFPVPNFESFTLEADSGETFIAVVLDRDQSRPIVIIKEGQTVQGKSRLVLGDVWIKKNTDTVRASRDHLDAMYQARMEREAEDRARKRFKHFTEENLIGLQQSTASKTPSAPPTLDLLIGPRSDLTTFCEHLIATNDISRFRMLLELGRETLVEGWDNLEEPEKMFDSNSQEFVAKVNEFYKNQFSPVLDTIVECGVIGVKHRAQIEWLFDLVDLVDEVFTECGNLKSRPGTRRIGNVPFYTWRPAFDCYVGIRALAVYMIHRDRFTYLETILPRIVKAVSTDPYSRTAKASFVLWPFASLPIGKEFNDGRAQFFWKQRISASWGQHFRSAERFLDASCRLEFLLEFNSYLGTNSQQDKKFGDWLSQHLDSEINLFYTPDLYSQDLQATAPMADLIYDLLVEGSKFPSYLAIDPQIPNQALTGMDKSQRLEMYGDFLHGLKSWQSSFLWNNSRRMGFMWDWEGRLKQITDPAAQRSKLKHRNGG